MATESRLRRGVKGGWKISAVSLPLTCLACFQFAKCNFFSFREHDLRSRTAERKKKGETPERPGLETLAEQRQKHLSDRPVLFGERFVGAERRIVVDRLVREFEAEGWFGWSQSAGAVFLFPEIQMAQDVLNHLPILDQ